MKTIVRGIHKEGRADHYVADVDVDGVAKRFVIHAVEATAARPLDREFMDIRREQIRFELDDVVTLVLRFHAGERLSFPIDLLKL